MNLKVLIKKVDGILELITKDKGLLWLVGELLKRVEQNEKDILYLKEELQKKANKGSKLVMGGFTYE